MSLVELRERIERKRALLAVIGLGYVGLPVACEFARAGFDVCGLEIQQERVQKINVGISPIEGTEPGLAELLYDVVQSKRLAATTDYGTLRERDVILISVETPVDAENTPRYEALRTVLLSLGPVLKPGALVIVESTIAPGTMRDLVTPLLERSSGLRLNEGFFLGHCPERVMPGRLLANLRSVSRVVGGMTPLTADTMVALYGHVVQADLDATDCITAELVKTTENAYRDVQIAFANEVALICETVGGDVWRVRELVNKSPGRAMLLPGAGVGGHCIPKDPWLLAYGARDQRARLRLIPAARAINDTMPERMVELLEEALVTQDRQLSAASILVLGYAYLEESDDTRNSPSAVLADLLLAAGARVIVHDPFVPGYKGDLLQMANGCDAAVLMVRHRAYLDLDLDALGAALQTPVLIDGRHAFSAADVVDKGLVYRGIGLGTASAENA